MATVLAFASFHRSVRVAARPVRGFDATSSVACARTFCAVG
jgi:hypothetical protein